MARKSKKIELSSLARQYLFDLASIFSKTNVEYLNTLESDKTNCEILLKLLYGKDFDSDAFNEVIDAYYSQKNDRLFIKTLSKFLMTAINTTSICDSDGKIIEGYDGRTDRSKGIYNSVPKGQSLYEKRPRRTKRAPGEDARIGKHYYTNGVTRVFARECPDGFWPISKHLR